MNNRECRIPLIVFAGQQAWCDVPLLAVLGLDAGGFFVEFDDGAVDGLAGGAGEADAVAEVEACELYGALGLCEELEAFDDLGVEEAEVVFAEVLDGACGFVAVQPGFHGFVVGHAQGMIRGGVEGLQGCWRTRTSGGIHLNRREVLTNRIKSSARLVLEMVYPA